MQHKWQVIDKKNNYKSSVTIYLGLVKLSIFIGKYTVEYIRCFIFLLINFLIMCGNPWLCCMLQKYQILYLRGKINHCQTLL